MAITTKTGDSGETSLLFGRRVSKTHVRIEACGAADELNARLGAVRAVTSRPDLAEALLAIQKELVMLMGEVAVLDEDRETYFQKGFKAVTTEMSDRLTGLIVELEADPDLSYEKWATPGENPTSAAFELARTACRNAERRFVEVRESGGFVSDLALIYLNRLSDLLWLWARATETNP